LRADFVKFKLVMIVMDIFEVISKLCLKPEVSFLLQILGGMPVPNV